MKQDMTKVGGVDIGVIAAFIGDAASNNSYNSYLNYKQGHWTSNNGEQTIDEQERFSVEGMGSFSSGAINWPIAKGKPLAEVMEPMDSGRTVDIDQLPEHPNSKGWQEQKGMLLISIDTGDRFEFKSGTLGGKKAISKLLEKMMSQAKRGDNIYPVFHLSSSSYIHSGNGNEVHEPVFVVDEWLEHPYDFDRDAANDASVDDSIIDVNVA